MSINYELFARQVQRKAFKLIKQRNLSGCNAIGVGIDEHPEKGPIFLLALDLEGVEDNQVLPFEMKQIIEKGVDAFAETIADIVQKFQVEEDNEVSFPYLVDYELKDQQVGNMVGCHTLNQAKEIAEFIFEGYKKTSSNVVVRVINDDEGIIEMVFK